jgi:hypothetical protein
VKYILIIIYILLLSPPLFGNVNIVAILYKWKTASGVQWKEFGDKDIHPQYKGDVENGEPDGLGIIINTNKGKYVGEWKDGKKQGQGTFTYGKGKWEGEKYEGEFKDGYRHGQGTYTWSDGDKYAGEFKDDKPNGQGTYTWSDGRKYEGEFEDGIKHGQGTYTSIRGYKYVGEWRENKSWNGKEYDENGNVIGKFVNGVKIIVEPVVVVEKKPAVIIVEPVVVIDKKPAVVIDKKPSVVVEKKPSVVIEKKPAVVVNKKRQNGVLFRRWENLQWRWFRNGNEKKDRKYVGNIHNGGPNGQGILFFPDGDKYVGKFKDGEYHGQGTYTFHDGAKYVGEFKNGKVWNGTVHNGNLEYKIVKGK